MQIPAKVFQNAAENLRRYISKINTNNIIYHAVELAYFINSRISKDEEPGGGLNGEEIYRNIKEAPIFSIAIPVISNFLSFMMTKNIAFIMTFPVFIVMSTSFLGLRIAKLSGIDPSEKENRRIISDAVRKVLAKYWKQLLIQKGVELSRNKMLMRGKKFIVSMSSPFNSEIMNTITKELINEFVQNAQGM